MLCYDSRMKYCFIFYMKMLCLKFEKNYSQYPILPKRTHIFRFWVLFVCLTNAKKTVLVSLNVISLPQPKDRYVLPQVTSTPLLLFFPRLKRLNTSPLHVLVVKVRWVHGTSSRWLYSSSQWKCIFLTFSNKKRNPPMSILEKC